MRKKGYGLSSAFIDFLFLLALCAAAVAIALFMKAALYGSQQGGGDISLVTERMSYAHSGKLRVGDTVYDTVTKRRIGETTFVNEIKDGEKIYFELDVRADRYPRSAALRTERLWFYFKERDNESEDRVGV